MKRLLICLLLTGCSATIDIPIKVFVGLYNGVLTDFPVAFYTCDLYQTDLWGVFDLHGAAVLNADSTIIACIPSVHKRSIDSETPLYIIDVQ